MKRKYDILKQSKIRGSFFSRVTPFGSYQIYDIYYTMNTVNFCGSRISKLIVGDNPFNGHSYIEDKTPGSEMTDFYTAGRILETLYEIEKSGINCMLPLADPFIIRLLKEYERSGGRLKWIFQPYMPMDQTVSVRQMLSLQNTIGIYHQGTTTDFCYETGRFGEVKERIELYRSTGLPVGIGTHRPDVIDAAVNLEFNVDFFVACMQNARINREGEPSGFITGKTKSKLIFRKGDRDIMLKCLQKYDKPVIAYKIFAGGQMFTGRGPDEIRGLIRDAYDTVFKALKPDDIACIGVFQRDKDELGEDVEIYNEWYEENG